MYELFNQTDIDANRQAKLSPSQEQFIKDSVDPKVWIWGTGICLGLGVLSGACLVSIGGGSALGILGPVLGLVFLFCAARLAMMWNLRRKLLSDPVTAAEGTVTFKKLDILDQPRYNAETMDGKRLLSQGLAGFSVMLPPGDYTFYYLPTRNWLLSSAPLSSEAELRDNMISVLGDVFGFNADDLEGLRAQAAAGEVKTVEGRPKIETKPSGTSNVDDTYATIGGVQFLVPLKAAYAFIPELAYRVYYYEQKPTNFLSKIVSALSNTYIAAIEPL